MKKIIFGSLLSLAVLIYFTNQSGTEKENSLDIVKDSALGKNSNDIHIVYKEDSKSKNIHTPNKQYSLEKIKITNPTMAELYKTDKARATYQGIQSSKRAYYTQMKKAQKVQKERMLQREIYIKRHQEQQKFIAMQAIKRQNIQRNRVESTNLRYKSINQQNMQRTISNIKEKNKS